MAKRDPLGRTPMFNLATIQPTEAKAPWTTAQLDAFMEMYLDGVGLMTIAKRMGRTLDGVKILPWKLATRYLLYTPTQRINRDGDPLGPRATELLRIGRHSPEAAKHGVDEPYLAALLGRHANGPIGPAPRIAGFFE